MNAADWTFLAVVADGEALDIEGIDVWGHTWQRLDIGTLDVPHPSYPQQSHKLWPYTIEANGAPLIFCAGELSNGVWCFYVPAGGQPAQTHKGATVNEQLVLTAWSDPFDAAIEAGNERRAADILVATGLARQQAVETVAAILADPQ